MTAVLHAGRIVDSGGERAEIVGDFAEFVRMSLPGLLRYGHALTGNPHDAADLVQTVLEKVGSRWQHVLGKGDEPLAYVRCVMANTHVSVWRRRRRENLSPTFRRPRSTT